MSETSRSTLIDEILTEHPRLGLDDTFRFDCHPGVSCFTCCCSDVNIFLSPYDVLRLKNRLGITSGEFLDRYAIVPIQKDMKTPVVLLRMGDDEGKSCQLLGEDGCSVYADRPWPCRMYPLGLAAQRDTGRAQGRAGWRGEHFYFLLREDACKGFGEDREWTVRQWLDDQGLDAWEEWGEAYKELTLHPFLEGGGEMSPQHMHMFFTACWDLDRFREFVFGTTLLQRFDVDEEFVEEMRHDDEALLRFSFLWLRFSLFGEPTMRIRPEVQEAFKGSLDKKALFAEAGRRAMAEAERAGTETRP